MTAALRPVLFLTISCVALGVDVAAAQGTGSLRGQVRDQAGRFLADAEVVIAGASRTATTTVSGNFVVDGLVPGEYEVIVRLPGFTPRRLPVTIAAGRVTVLELVLEALPQQLDPIDVTGARVLPTLIGYVHDTFGRPLEHAEVLLDGVGRIRTSANGTFRIDSLEARRYQVTVRLPGYAAAHSLVPMNASRPTEVALRLQAFAQDLGTIEVAADRRGLHGVVATPDLQPVVGARVRLHGGGTSQLTDSAGRFAFPRVKPGDYLVAAEFKGLTGRALQVEMIRDGRREVVITLSPPNPNRRRMPGERWVNHDRGLALSFTSSLHRITRSELARHAGKQLCDIGRVRLYAGSSEATIILDGTRALNPWSLCAFTADELAMVTFGRRNGGCCTLNGLPIFPPAGLKCLYLWTR
jgi:protocatechuate 3,4-dioxygenase beta subunit